MTGRDDDLRSPAQRYSDARERASASYPLFNDFRRGFDFGLDQFQIQACHMLEDGHSVLVAAPTGSGKTVVGEFAVHLAISNGTRAFYTTPIKALSNQKFRDLVQRYGREQIGLLTGDTVINGDAPVVVMTTEVVRNMLYDGSPAISGLSHVVLDEVHYLADRERGAVWEEVILHLPESVSIAALSATVSNAEEFGSWLEQVRGQTDVIVEDRRPVPLHQHVLAGNRMLDLIVGDDDGARVNPELVRFASESKRHDRSPRPYRGRGRRGRSEYRGRQSGGARRMRRADVLDRLDRLDLLPAIVFIFSRKGCDDAVSQCLDDGVDLTSEHERQEIAKFVRDKCADLPHEDRAVLGFYEWSDALERGLAAHHAGMLPLFKETVEELFTRGLLRAVFATETLALGINMPARTVVLERMTKWDGHTHADITANEYTQLTGRAGRRGIDTEGHAVVVFSDEVEPNALAGLATTRTYPLRSSFRPSYNMAINMVSRIGRNAAREVLETSFAQYQADAGVVGLAAQIRKHETAMAGYADSMQCDRGDFREYARIRRQIKDIERQHARDGAASRRDSADHQLAQLQVGEIIAMNAGRRVVPAVVVSAAGDVDDPRPMVLTLDRRVRKLTATDIPHGVTRVATMTIPRGFDGRSANWRRDISRSLADATNGIALTRNRMRNESAPKNDDELSAARAQLRKHPCHACPDREQHARWASRYEKLDKETSHLRSKVETRTNTVARQFDRVCELLVDLGYLRSDHDSLSVSPEGFMLGRLYVTADLLTAQCLRRQIWGSLNAAELAACASALVFESRTPDDGRDGPPLPSSASVRHVLREQEQIAAELIDDEMRYKLNYVRMPNPGFANAAYLWTQGQPLHRVLRASELAPGDFVRWCRQLIDLLAQIADASAASADQADIHIRREAQIALDSLRRGVVAYSAPAE